MNNTILIGILTAILAALAVKVFEKIALKPHSWLVRKFKKFQNWLILRPVGYNSGFQILENISELENWLKQKQRLTFKGAYKPRAKVYYPQNNTTENTCNSRRILIQASVDIGKTREALYIINDWIESPNIKNNVSILVPRDLFSLPDDMLSISDDRMKALFKRNIVLFLDDLPILCRDPDVAKEPGNRLRRLLDQFRLRCEASLLIVATGRIDALRQQFGDNYVTNVFKTFEVFEIPDFSSEELEQLIIYIAAQKHINAKNVSSRIATVAGNTSAENIVQFLNNCAVHASLSKKLPRWRRIFGANPEHIKDIVITPELINYLSERSMETWKNLVYYPVKRNYPEIAAIYESIAILVEVGILPYVEIVITLSCKLLGFGILKKSRIEKALRFMLKQNLHVALNDDGTIYCPDVVTDAINISTNQQEIIKALVRSIKPFTENQFDETSSGFSRLYGRMIAGIVIIFLSYIISGLISAWFFPGNLFVPPLFTNITMCTIVFLILMIGYRFRSNEIQLLIFLFVTLCCGKAGYLFLLNSSEMGVSNILGEVSRFLFLSLLLTIFAGEFYKRISVSKTLRPMPLNIRELQYLLQGLNFRSPGRNFIWLNRIAENFERGWFIVIILFLTGIIYVVISKNALLGPFWNYNFITYLCVIASVMAWWWRPHRALWESFILIGCFIFTFSFLFEPKIWSYGRILSLIAWWWMIWLIMNSVYIAGRVLIGRHKPTLDPQSLISWQPIFASQPFRYSYILSTRSLAWLGCIYLVLSLSSIGFDFQGWRYRLSIASASRISYPVKEHAFARMVWTKLLRVMPKNSALHYRLGYELYSSADYESALDHFHQASLSSPSNPIYTKLKFLSALYSGKDEIALEALHSTTLDFKSKDLELMDPLLLFLKENYRECLSSSIKICSKWAEHDEVWTLIAMSLIELNECSKIVDISKSLNNNSPYALLAKAKCERANGNISSAISIYERLANENIQKDGISFIAKEYIRILKSWGHAVPKQGALIMSISPDGQAAATRNISPGDIIISVEGHPVRFVADTTRWRIKLKDHKLINWEIWREGRQIKVTTLPLPLHVFMVDF